MKRTLVALSAAALVIVCGVVHGTWTDRWQDAPAATADAAARMGELPLEVGDWSGTVFDVKKPRAGDVAGTIERRYQNRRNGDAVSVYMVCGRPGPVSIHTPEVCYAASGFIVGTKSKAAVREQAGEFWSADAVKSKAGEETRLRIYWAWNDGKGWQAPAGDPRWTFTTGRHPPVLYKLYVLRDMQGPARAGKDDPCETFLRAFLPEMDHALFAPGS